jgi:ABC-2 type transport system permease protein
MTKVLKIARRDYLAATRTKGFVIGLLLAPMLMGGSFLAMHLFGQQNDTTDRTIAVVDHTGVFAAAMIAAAERREPEVFDPASGKKVKSSYRIETVVAGDFLTQRGELSGRIRAGALHGFLEVLDETGEEGRRPGLRYFSDRPLDGVKEWVTSVVNEEIRRRRLAELGLDPGLTPGLFDWQAVEAMEPVTLSRDGTVQEARQMDPLRAAGVPIGMALLTFMLVMIGASPLLNSVMEEKTQGMAEVMLGSVTPFQFMMGKVLGMLGVSLTASVVYLAGGIFTLLNAGMAGFIPFRVLPWFLVYVVLAILMVGSVMAGLGAACNDARDAQNLALPGLSPVLIPVFMLVPVLQDPVGSLATWLSLVPLFTPVLMIIRLSTPAAIPAWQPWLGLIGVLVTTALLIWAGGRIFRVGILMQGQPPNLRTLGRWLLRG